MVETCKKAIDRGKEYSALLTDLSEAFDCAANNLVMTKLHPYGFYRIFESNKSLFNKTQTEG